MDRNDQKAYVYDEAANGLMVRIPVDRYADWKATQDRIRRGEKVETDPEMTKRLAALMKGEEIADFEKKSPIIAKPTTRSTQIEDTSTKEQKIMSFITSKRIAAIFSIILCITLYFGLLENVFTKKIETLIVYTQEGSEYVHGAIHCSVYDGKGESKKYRFDSSQPFTATTLYDFPDSISCSYGCMAEAKSTTITVKNYIFPLVISLTISGIVFCILIYKKKT